MSEALLQVRNLKKYFKTKAGPLHAVDDISFDVKRGETLAADVARFCWPRPSCCRGEVL